RLARPELALDLDHVEEAGEIVALDLAALLRLVPVGDEGHGHPALAQPAERLHGAGEETHHLPAAGREVLGDGGGESVVRRPQPLEAVGDDLGPGPQHVDALAAVALWIVPEPATRRADRLDERRHVHPRRRDGPAGRLPAVVPAAR